MRNSIDNITPWLLNTSPLFTHMRGQPEFKNWAKDLIVLSQAEKLTPLREVLVAIANNALSTTEALNHFLDNQAQTLSLYVYLEASVLAEKAMIENPYSSFVLAFVSLLGWARLLGESLYPLVLYYPTTPYLDLGAEGVYYDNLEPLPHDSRLHVFDWTSGDLRSYLGGVGTHSLCQRLNRYESWIS